MWPLGDSASDWSSGPQAPSCFPDTVRPPFGGEDEPSEATRRPVGSNVYGSRPIDRLATCLERLLPHLVLEEVAVTGGVALEHHAPGSRAEVGDVDLVAGRMEAVAGTVRRDFLVSHHHRAGPGVPKAMIQLVDPESRLRVDVFPDLGGVVGRAVHAALAGRTFPVVRARNLLEHKLQTLRRGTVERPVDPKHWRDAQRLAELCAESLPPLALHLAPSRYGTDLTVVCERCELSRDPALPLAPKAAILAVLGHV